MPAYCLFRCLRENDPKKFDEYRAVVRATLKPFNVRILSLHPAFEQLEGPGPTKSIALLEFHSMDEARRWYNSPEYQAIIPLRTQSGEYEAFLFDGMPLSRA